MTVTPASDLPPEIPDYQKLAQQQLSAAIQHVQQMSKAEYLAFVRETLDGLQELIRRKNTDYTAGVDDPFANFRASEDWGVDPYLGLCVRFGDKVQRLKSFAKSGKLLTDSLEDAWLDTIGYACIALGMLKEKRRNTPAADPVPVQPGGS